MSTKRTAVIACHFTIALLETFLRIRGLEQHGHAADGATKAPVGLLLVRGSQPVGMSNKRLRFTVRREDSNSNDDDRSQRLKQGGVVGAAF